MILDAQKPQKFGGKDLDKKLLGPCIFVDTCGLIDGLLCSTRQTQKSSSGWVCAEMTKWNTSFHTHYLLPLKRFDLDPQNDKSAITVFLLCACNACD